MKVLLINPSSFGSSYGDYSEVGGRNAPLGLAYIASVLRENKIDVSILDADILNLTLQQTIDKVKQINPDIIGLTCMTASFEYAEELAKKIKEILPKVPILIGGAHVTAMPDFTLNKDCFDIGIIGEGEYTFLEIIKNFKNINGIVFKDKNKIIKTKPRELTENLDNLPLPAWDLLPNLKKYHPQLIAYKKRPHASIITSRGCPYSCIFCDKNVFGSKYRTHSAERVIREIEYLKNNYGIKEIKMLDDQFTLDKKRLEKFCDLMIAQKINIPWSCSSRVDVIDAPLYKKMRKAGCWLIAIGIESGNQKVLDFIKKGITLQQVRNALMWAKQAGIKVRGFFMIGHPTDTKETIEDTVRFALSLPLYTAEFTIATPFQNTVFYEMAKSGQYGEFDEGDLSKFSTMFPTFVPKGLTKEYLEKKQKEAHRRYYFRISKILDFMLQIRSFEDIRRNYIGFKTLLHAK